MTDIERANLLLALKQMPGYVELLRLSAQLAQRATDALVDFGGWDMQQIAVLKARAQAAKEFNALLWSTVDDVIRQGIAEAARAEAAAKKSQENATRETIDAADRLRVQVLTMPEAAPDDDQRVAGSY